MSSKGKSHKSSMKSASESGDSTAKQVVRAPSEGKSRRYIKCSTFVLLFAVAAFLVVSHMRKAIQREKLDIFAFNEHYKGDAAAAKTQQQTSTADIFYNIVTDFYEWGWGPSFHFATRHSQETFRESLRRHEYYLSNKLQLRSGMNVLDMGSGKKILNLREYDSKFIWGGLGSFEKDNLKINDWTYISAKEI